MIKQTRVILLALTAIAAIIIFSNLSAQTFDNNNYGTNQNQMKMRDFSSFSVSGGEARTSFKVSAEVVDSKSSAELLEDTEELSTDGTSKKIGLTISLQRLIFENDVKTAEINMTNTGDIETVYRIKLVNTIIDEKGNRKHIDEDLFKNNTEKTVLFADNMLKFAPRWVRLKPAEQQKIRVAALTPAGLGDGEYRSDLRFSWLPGDEEPVVRENLEEFLSPDPASIANTNIADEEPSKAVYIPLIVRKGELSASGELAELQLENADKSTKLNLKILREGNRSLYGDLLIYGLNNQNEKTELLQKVSNIAVYPPTPQLSLTVDISDAISKGGDETYSLVIEYTAKSDEKNAVIASATIKRPIGERVSADK